MYTITAINYHNKIEEIFSIQNIKSIHFKNTNNVLCIQEYDKNDYLYFNLDLLISLSIKEGEINA